MRTRCPPFESGPEHFHGNSSCQTLPASRRRFMKTKHPWNSGGKRRHETMRDSAWPEACRSPGLGVCNMGATFTTGRHTNGFCRGRPCCRPLHWGRENLKAPEPQNPKPRARERVNSKRSPRTCTIPECRADSLESWSSTTHHQTADVRNRQLPRKAGAYPANPFALERRGLPEPNKSALPHCLASISRPNASRNTRTSQSRAWPSNTGRKPPANARIKGARGESCATNRNSEIPPSNEPRDQLARTHPALFRAISLNHRSDPAEILPNSDQGSQPQSIRYPVPSLEYF